MPTLMYLSDNREVDYDRLALLKSRHDIILLFILLTLIHLSEPVRRLPMTG